MKRYKIVIAVAVIAVIVLAAGLYSVFATDFWHWRGETSQVYSLYFLDTTKTKLVVEEREANILSGVGGLRTLVEMLVAGPKNTTDCVNAIPSDTKVLDIEKKGELITVNFSKEYRTETYADDMLATFTVVSTLCDRPGVNKVAVLVEGEELINSDKKPLGALSKDDIVYVGANKSASESLNLKLYFPTSDGNTLVTEYRSVSQKNKESLAKLAITELMKGPENSTAVKLIPAEAKLLSVETKDSVCFVNFSKEFVDKRATGGAAESLCIYSIVNTLTNLEDIEKVQFLIEGKRIDSFGSIVMNEPLGRNTVLIRE